MIERYSPNIRWGKQHVEITLMQWDYSAKFTVDVGGNCTGLTVIDCAVENLYGTLLGEKPFASVALTRPDGDTLECSDDDERDDDWLKDMVVKAEIVGWTPPTQNEVREMNGAPPLPEGDRPWDPR